MFIYCIDDTLLKINKKEDYYVLTDKKQTLEFKSKSIDEVIKYLKKYIETNNLYEYMDMSGEFTIYGCDFYVEQEYINYFSRYFKIEYNFNYSKRYNKLIIKKTT